MPLRPAIGALIAGNANNDMPMMNPNRDFSAKPVNIRLMMSRPPGYQLADKLTSRGRCVFQDLAGG
jgi:hypothetical protein